MLELLRCGVTRWAAVVVGIPRSRPLHFVVENVDDKMVVTSVDPEASGAWW